MKSNSKKELIAVAALIAAFAVWTALIMLVDVCAIGPRETSVGFAAFNLGFHKLTGVNMTLYAVTDWLGLVPILVCICFGVLGLSQLIRRRSLLRVDTDIILLGVYYVLVIAAYLFFEMVPVNYRPILIDGNLEASYPSSTTLLVLSVMPTLKFQADCRCKNRPLRIAANIFVFAFSVFMVVGRLVSGVHWATDIIGSVLLSFGLFMLYKFCAEAALRRKSRHTEE